MAMRIEGGTHNLRSSMGELNVDPTSVKGPTWRIRKQLETQREQMSNKPE